MTQKDAETRRRGNAEKELTAVSIIFRRVALSPRLRVVPSSLLFRPRRDTLRDKPRLFFSTQKGSHASRVRVGDL
jgi:hypothetical protein